MGFRVQCEFDLRVELLEDVGLGQRLHLGLLHRLQVSKFRVWDLGSNV